ncbi:uncharacterized protein LOC112567190 [Pomacea canaliculata]|uniref:uncharacterized protein LOC112567190 n=1 Tax=Pomacea canaliculata TaxID=400727 RepID=UPI000D734DE2|nr:uncharacterized protein LOC112567190 [Pomacea canaliculata]
MNDGRGRVQTRHILRLEAVVRNRRLELLDLDTFCQCPSVCTMNSFVVITTAVLLGVFCTLTSAQANAKVNSLFSRFFNTAKASLPTATCDWLQDHSKLQELRWAEDVDLCFNTGPGYTYPEADVQTALKNDPAASEFLSYVTQCYSSQTQNYYNAWNNVLYTQDLCPVRPTLLDKVWRYNHIDRRQDHCYIVQPEVQRVALAQCGDGLGQPNSQKCKRDATSYFEGNYFCVPDGYVKRTVLIYCPWDPEVQCIPARVRIPTGCSCKQYTCDKVRASVSGK